MVKVEDIKGYWASSELSALATLDFDGKTEDQKIQDAIDDAYVELSPIKGSIETAVADLYAKRLTICILITKLNISLEAVEAQMEEGNTIRKMIAKAIDAKVALASQQDINDLDATTGKFVVTAGSNTLRSDIEGFME